MQSIQTKIENMVGQMIQKKRDIAIDVMKGIGILLVLLGHVWPPLPVIHNIAVSFHMPMFFMVAGYFSKS